MGHSPGDLDDAGRPQRSKSVSADADRKFFDLFMVVLAALVGISVLIWVISDRISDGTQKQYLAETAEYQAEIADRIAPVGTVRLPGEAAAAEAAVQAVPEPVATELTGAQVYNANCGACHTNGIGGAPKIGDGDAWVALAAQGLEILRTTPSTPRNNTHLVSLPCPPKEKDRQRSNKMSPLPRILRKSKSLIKIWTPLLLKP